MGTVLFAFLPAEKLFLQTWLYQLKDQLDIQLITNTKRFLNNEDNIQDLEACALDTIFQLTYIVSLHEINSYNISHGRCTLIKVLVG